MPRVSELLLVSRLAAGIMDGMVAPPISGLHWLVRTRGIAVAMLAALLAGCGPLGGDGGRPLPDVVLVLVDTLRADRTAALSGGQSLTPHLAALAARGTTYRAAVAPSSWTLPSVAALFSGREITARRTAAFEDVPALAERFAAAGYRTVGLVANPLLTADNGFTRGFEEWSVAPAASTASLSADVFALRSWDAAALSSKALVALRRSDDSRPVFLYLHLMDPHIPYDPGNERLAVGRAGWSAPEAGGGRSPPAWLEQPTETQAAFLAGWRRAYDGQVAFVDAALGRLAAALSRADERVLLAITSDHGEGLFSHRRDADSPSGPGVLGEGYDDHGEQLYEEAVRVPLLLVGPGVPVRLETRPVALQHLGETLVRLAGLPAAEGAPVLPLGPGDAVPTHLFGTGTRGWYARSASAKLLVPFENRTAMAPRLFDVSSDRYEPELIDRVAEQPAPAGELEAALETWRTRHGKEAESAPDPATLERLKLLGYVR